MFLYYLYSLLFPIRILTFLSVSIVSIIFPSFIERYFKSANLLILLSLGIYPNNIIDYRKKKFNTDIIVFQHRSFADCFIINYTFGPVGYVFRNIFKNNLLIKYYIERYGGIDVSANGKEGKTKEILKYIKNNDRKLAIAPEDITNYKTRIVSNHTIGVFKSGAFVARVPIQPVTINFHDKNVIWKNYDNGFESISYWFFKQFLSPLTYIDICLLQECSCSENMTISEYKDFVRNNMLDVVINY